MTAPGSEGRAAPFLPGTETWMPWAMGSGIIHVTRASEDHRIVCTLPDDVDEESGRHLNRYIWEQAKFIASAPDLARERDELKAQRDELLGLCRRVGNLTVEQVLAEIDHCQRGSATDLELTLILMKLFGVPELRAAIERAEKGGR
jgi:hypothetical protein